jgi:hypothetical protein
LSHASHPASGRREELRLGFNIPGGRCIQKKKKPVTQKEAFWVFSLPLVDIF